jgi:peptidoglycan hydrolase-like protein with peptidoglycan-binding domain
MAMLSADRAPVAARRGSGRLVLGFLIPLAIAIVALIAAVAVWSGATLSGDQVALARVDVGLFGGSLERVSAYGSGGRRIPLAVHGGRLTPLVALTPGEQVSVEVTVRRPSWLGWALGKEHTERLTLQAPLARPSVRWLTVTPGSAVQVGFDQPVAEVAYGSEGNLARHALDGPRQLVSLGRRAQIGTLQIAAAVRPWERLGAPASVSWFPPSRFPVMVVSPAPGSDIAPAQRISLTFSKPVEAILGSAHPKLLPSTSGRWQQTDPHTLTFTPSGYGAPFASQLHVELPHAVAIATASGDGTHTTSQIAWTVPTGSTLRLQQLLAEAGYLPLEWKPSGAPVRRTPSAEVQAAVDPPKGSFSWRYPGTPASLQALWSPGAANVITRGAVMKFENTHLLTVDGLAGQTVWRALIRDVIASKGNGGGSEGGYTYVYVHREASPETITLWHDGHTILTSPANTGISGAETALGTFPVFEHIPEGTMSGTNPDGSHYSDPGIKWISYFNGGDAIHNFDRASFGSPQSLGCVELPLEASARVWPYTPIGTLVTVES